MHVDDDHSARKTLRSHTPRCSIPGTEQASSFKTKLYRQCLVGSVPRFTHQDYLYKRHKKRNPHQFMYFGNSLRHKTIFHQQAGSITTPRSFVKGILGSDACISKPSPITDTPESLCHLLLCPLAVVTRHALQYSVRVNPFSRCPTNNRESKNLIDYQDTQACHGTPRDIRNHSHTHPIHFFDLLHAVLFLCMYVPYFSCICKADDRTNPRDPVAKPTTRRQES